MSACRESGFCPPDTGSARDDLQVFVRGFMHTVRTSDAGRVMPAIVAELVRNPELAAAFREGFVQPRRARVLEAVRRGIDRGEVRPDVDPELVADGVVALLMHRFLITGMEIDDALPERVLDLLWRGIVAT
jgi:hypothetical protein